MTVDLLPSLGRAAAFLGIPFIIAVFIMQWQWARTCSKNIRVLVAQKSGGGKFELAPKDGGSITIKNPVDGTTRVWPVNELATIDVLYPGVGFVPAFMQKTIRMAIVNEGDWEPMLNRSPHRKNIASPDVVEFMQSVAQRTKDIKLKTEIEAIVNTLETGSTREMIADPSILGNLMQSSIMKALATVSNDLMDVLKSVNAKLGKVQGANPMVVYIGLGLIVIVLCVLAFKTLPMAEELTRVQTDLALIKQSLGIVTVVPPVAP